MLKKGHTHTMTSWRINEWINQMNRNRNYCEITEFSFLQCSNNLKNIQLEHEILNFNQLNFFNISFSFVEISLVLNRPNNFIFGFGCVFKRQKVWLKIQWKFLGWTSRKSANWISHFPFLFYWGGDCSCSGLNICVNIAWKTNVFSVVCALFCFCSTWFQLFFVRAVCWLVGWFGCLVVGWLAGWNNTGT